MARAIVVRFTFRLMGKQETTTLTTLPLPGSVTREPAGARLVVADGPDQGIYADLRDRPITIGTGPECDLLLNDASVSRTHVRASWANGAVKVADLDSKTGSFAAGNRFRLADVGWGGTFTIGHTVIKVVPVADPDPVEASLHGSLVGASVPMREVFALVDQVAPSNACVLIEGETGVGKELVAEEIHRRSQRRHRPFIVFDCGSVVSGLIESTLFGHTKGAFTGAIADHVGVFEEADGGTLFLDEIGELAPHLQPSLLRAVDRGMIRPVGTSAHKPVDVRVIAATHRSLAEMIDNETFREDLYYRLSVVRLAVPPVRERRDDIPLLVRHFLRRRGRGDLRVSDEQMAKLTAYGWPGNVRELQNRVDRAVVLARDGALSFDELPTRGRPTHPPPFAASPPRPSRQPFREAKADAITAFEREYLSALVDEFPTLQTAADAAGMDRKHLRVLLRRYDLKSD